MAAGKKTVGHPVDVATGEVYTIQEDISIAGKMPLVWERRYGSSLEENVVAPLGTGWTTRYFMTITREEDGFRIVNSEGGTEFLDDRENMVDNGGTLHDFAAFQELSKIGHRYVLTSWDVETGEVLRYVFRECTPGYTAQLASIENLTGQALDLEYDYHQRLVGIRQRLEKRRLVVKYTPIDRIDTISFELPDETLKPLVQYGYDANGRLVSATDVRGYVDRYEYDGENRLTREIIKDGGVFYFRYDEKGRCVKTSGLDRYDEKSLKFFDHIGWTEVTDSRGFVTRYQHNANGQIVTEVSPTGGKSETEYDDLSRIIRQVDPNGGAIVYEYDAMGNRAKITDQLENSWNVTFNEFHQPVQLDAPNGGVWKRVYDDRHRLIETVNPLGASWNLEYDQYGNLISSTDPEGAAYRQSFFANGILRDISDPLGNLTSFQFDAYGRIAGKTGPLGDITLFDYDEAGNPVSILFPDKTAIQGEYDTKNNLISFTDGEGRTTRYRYGSCGRLMEKIDPLDNSVKYEWGTEPGCLDRVINEKGEVYSFERDGSGNIVRETGFDARVHQFEFDAAGRCRAATNNLGERTVYTRNPQGKLTGELMQGGETTAFGYDPLGNIISAVNKTCKVAFERDPLGRIVRETQGDEWVETVYDAVNNVVKNTTGRGLTVTYSHDANGNAVGLVTGDGHAMSFTRNAYGDEVSRLLPGKRARLDQKFDAVGQLVEQRLQVQPKGVSAALSFTDQITGSAGTVISRDYRYNRAGSLMTINDGFWGATEYVYDPGDRLIRAVREKGASERFSYDATGNIISHDADERVRPSEFTAGNQIVCTGDTRFEFDGNGRRTRKIENASSPSPEEWIYTWDERDQLTAITRPDGTVWNYRYDALGRRIAKESPHSRESFVWYGNVVIHHLVNDDDPVSWLFDQGTSCPLGKIEKGRFYTVVNDQLGTPRELVDEEGTIVWSVQQKSWGEVDQVRISDVACQIRFQGQWFDDESGLCYNRFRYYDGRVGQFVSKDPIRVKGGLNEYGFVINPISFIDRFGLTDCPKKQKEELDWSIIKKKTGETREEHVKLHGVNDLQKKEHGVFYGDPVATTNNAWANKGSVQPVTSGGTDVYHIPMGNTGYAGGYGGQGQNLNYVTVVTRKDTNQIITAYPSAGS